MLRIRKTAAKTLLNYKRNILTISGVKPHVEHETKIADAGEMTRTIEAFKYEH